MQSKAKDVATYLQEIPQDRRECLTRLRDLCCRTLTDYAEEMEYGMPCYKKGGVAEVAFASQKNYISLYILKESVVNAHRHELIGANIGKSCIRFSRPERMNFAVVEKLLADTITAPEAAC